MVQITINTLHHFYFFMAVSGKVNTLICKVDEGDKKELSQNMKKKNNKKTKKQNKELLDIGN